MSLRAAAARAPFSRRGAPVYDKFVGLKQSRAAVRRGAARSGDENNRLAHSWRHREKPLVGITGTHNQWTLVWRHKTREIRWLMHGVSDSVIDVEIIWNYRFFYSYVRFWLFPSWYYHILFLLHWTNFVAAIMGADFFCICIILRNFTQPRRTLPPSKSNLINMNLSLMRVVVV